jgi:hypothetical protein
MSNILKRIFKAKDAKEVVKKFYSDDLNYQRHKILNRIKANAAMGNTNIVLDDGYIKLMDEDYDFFKKLGYTVYPESYVKFCKLSDKLEYYKHTYGIISWED